MITLGSIIKKKIRTYNSYLLEYMIVLKSTSKKIIAIPLNGDELGDEMEISKEGVEECTTETLSISTEEMDKLIDGNARMIVHKALKAWCNVVDKKPEIIKLYDKNKRFIYYANCTYDRILRKRLVLKSIRKEERDIIESIPSVRIIFGEMLYAEYDD